MKHKIEHVKWRCH